MTVTYEDFRKLDLKTARVLSVREHPNADNLYILEIDTGTERKEIVAGIRRHYSPQELTGKDIVVIDNLAPAVIRGVASNGMLLAASSPEGVRVIAPDRSVPPGSVVK